ncbi:MAG: hypothetical protein IJZ64_04145, partial [Ruminococcus sp.]|nr:hypothetical protein [Ruminococcus sp.]
DDIFDEAFMLYVCINSENDDINFLTKYEKQDAKKYIETINILVESDGFFDFIKHLTIYSITDFQKKPKKIFSVSAEENSDIAHSFIFNSSLIEQGLIAKIQQFIISLKQDNANFYLTDIETCIQEDTENG